MQRRGFIQVLVASFLTPFISAKASEESKHLPVISYVGYPFGNGINVGDTWYNQELNLFYVFDGKKWLLISTK